MQLPVPPSLLIWSLIRRERGVGPLQLYLNSVRISFKVKVLCRNNKSSHWKLACFFRHNPLANCGFEFVNSFANPDIWFYVSAVNNLSRTERISGAGRGWVQLLSWWDFRFSRRRVWRWLPSEMLRRLLFVDTDRRFSSASCLHHSLHWWRQ
jgi:hypothetical protein